ncbi:ABC transporter ATP-binding protein/permease [Benzoatithermus flavus]|uniref:ABC transporter ATP-binding protein/permease n=1 Tax=Benzoatithermus flavus TaxID=3108223 RepID=A0ABU8XKG5_9PROT
MTNPVISRVADARGFLSQLWRLTAPYWWSEERWLARGLLAVIIGMSVFLVWLSKLLNDWNRAFFDALQNKDAASFWKLLISFESLSDFFFSFTGLVFIYIVVAVYRMWLRQYLTIRWRRWLTHVYFGDWLADRTYYRMELTGHGTDNPEQRIEYDINVFTTQTLAIVLGLLSELMTLGTFTFVLWQLSGSLTLDFLGGLEVPGYMVWVALLYAIAGSWATWAIGKRLVSINFNLERYNADFRYRLIRVRENAESIALYKGEPDEARRLSDAFQRIYDLFWDYMRVYKRLTWLNVFYSQVASVFPIVVQAPRYFRGEISLGVMTQTAGAFAQVQGSLSWFVDSFANLADWKAVVDRLTTFANTMAATKEAQAREHGFDVAPADHPALTLEDVEVALPDGRVLLSDLDLVVEPGQRLVIQGPSGSGKTTLFRVLSGLWPFGKGILRVPKGAKVLFLPQKPYIPIGTLKEAICYPDKPDAHGDAEVREALVSCKLAHLAGRLDESANWSMVLSPGEQQRLAFARVLLVRPNWLFLDEASSALDETTEARMYELIEERLPGTTIVSIAHKPSVLRFHDRRLVIDPATRRVSVSELAPAPGE